MFNTSFMEINSSSIDFDCLRPIHVGTPVGYIAMSLRLCVGIPAHLWLIWFDFHPDWKIKPTQVFFLNMSLLELIYFIPCTVEVLNILIFNNNSLWTVGFIGYGLNWVGRPLMQIYICVEQYLAVIHPIMFLKYKALQNRTVVAAAVWLIAAACAVCQMLMNTLVNHIFNSGFFISLIIILFCCASVLHALRHPGPGDTQNPMERGRDVGNQQKRKAFNIIFSGLLIILISYLPQVSFSLFNVLQIDEELLICDIVPIMSFVNIFEIMISPLMKMYKNGHSKCFTHQSKTPRTRRHTDPNGERE